MELKIFVCKRWKFLCTDSVQIFFFNLFKKARLQLEFVGRENSATHHVDVLPAIEVLVFATSIQSSADIDRIKGTLDNHPGISCWNVDLEDWEKILRIESAGIQSSEIVELLLKKGVQIKELT